MGLGLLLLVRLGQRCVDRVAALQHDIRQGGAVLLAVAGLAEQAEVAVRLPSSALGWPLAEWSVPSRRSNQAANACSAC